MTQYQQPPYYGSGPSLPAYIGLAFVGWLLRIAGWLGVAVGVVVLVVSLVGTAELQREYSEKHFQELHFSVFGIIPAITGVVWGLCVIGFGELFLAIRDIARNSFRGR